MNITGGDWIFYAVGATKWLNTAVFLVGLGIAVWAFLRCHKWGYLLMAFYFALVLFSLLVMPSINRAIAAHRPPDISEETQKKID
jgi:hypothetical protein